MLSPSSTQIASFLLGFYIFFIFIIYIFRDKRIFNKKLKEYVLPIKLYMLGAVIAVFLQYLAMSFPLSARIGQLLWELMIALSVIILVKKYNFNLKNIAFLGILYALFIHGAKVSLRYFIYGAYQPEIYRTLKYIAGRFIYGSVLAVIISIATFFAMSLVQESDKKQKDKKKIFKLVLGLILILIILIISVQIYGALG